MILKGRVTFCDVVKQPILSSGRLMRAGWSIDGMEECLKNGGVEVPLNYQNQSLVVQGSVRVILEPGKVRMLAVKLGNELTKTAEEGFRRWMGFGLEFITATGIRVPSSFQSSGIRVR